MTTHFLVDQGSFAVQASLMFGGYLAAVVLLAYITPSGKLVHAGRLLLALAVVLAAVVPILTPLALIIGAIAAIALWAISTTHKGLGLRQAFGHLWALIPATVLIGLLPTTDRWVHYSLTDPIATTKIGVFLAAYALATAPAAYAISWLLRRIDLPSGSPAPVGSRRAVTDSSSLTGEDQEPVLNSIQDEGEASRTADAIRAQLSRGRVIGVLERLILLTLALLGQWQAAGLVIAAKSIARFRNLETSRDLAEYYLVGTLASLLLAFLIAAAALALV